MSLPRTNLLAGPVLANTPYAMVKIIPQVEQHKTILCVDSGAEVKAPIHQPPHLIRPQSQRV